MTKEEFAQTIKQKYPQYNSVNDTELADKILVKYPQYMSRITTPSNVPPETSMATEGSGFGGFVKDLVSAPATILARPIQAVAELAGASAESVDKFSSKYSGGLVKPVPQNFSDVKKDVGRGVQTVAFGMPGLGTAGAAFGVGSSLEQGNDLFSLPTAFNTVLGAAGGKVLGLIGKPIFNVAGKVIGEITPKYLQDIASKGTQAIEEFAAQHEILPKVVRNATDAVSKKASAVGNVAKDAVAQELKPITDKFKGVFSSNFESSANKAFPVLKKDVANLPKRNEHIRTAFTDIAKNKESLGLADKAGNPRNPKTFVETLDAQNARLPQIYKDYTAKLSEVDRPKFDTNIQNGIKKQVSGLDSKIAKENSVDNRRALIKIKNELASLRDSSPEGIQNYIQTINQKVKPLAPGGSITPEQIQYANLGGDMRKILDESIDKIEGKGYQELRNTYASHKAIQSELLSAVKKEINKTPGFTEKLGNVGLSVEGLNFLLTHDPAALATGAGIKGATKFMAWIKSPQRALQNLFKEVETQITSSLLKPQAIKTTAKIEPKITTSKSITPKKKK